MMHAWSTGQFEESVEAHRSFIETLLQGAEEALEILTEESEGAQSDSYVSMSDASCVYSTAPDGDDELRVMHRCIREFNRGEDDGNEEHHVCSPYTLSFDASQVFDAGDVTMATHTGTVQCSAHVTENPFLSLLQSACIPACDGHQLVCTNSVLTPLSAASPRLLEALIPRDTPTLRVLQDVRAVYEDPKALLLLLKSLSAIPEAPKAKSKRKTGRKNIFRWSHENPALMNGQNIFVLAKFFNRLPTAFTAPHKNVIEGHIVNVIDDDNTGETLLHVEWEGLNEVSVVNSEWVSVVQPTTRIPLRTRLLNFGGCKPHTKQNRSTANTSNEPLATHLASDGHTFAIVKLPTDPRRLEGVEIFVDLRHWFDDLSCTQYGTSVNMLVVRGCIKKLYRNKRKQKLEVLIQWKVFTEQTTADDEWFAIAQPTVEIPVGMKELMVKDMTLSTRIPPAEVTATERPRKRAREQARG